MKKTLLAILLLAISNLSLFAQDEKYGKGSMPMVDGKVIFTEIVTMEGKTADQLYSQAKLAIAEMFKSAKDVIQLDDKENGVLVMKGANQYNSESIYTHFTLKISIKDGKYKADITNLTCQILPSQGIAARELTAEYLTDEKCLNSKGEIRRLSPGFDRRAIIDTKDQIFATLKKKMSENTINTNNDW